MLLFLTLGEVAVAVLLGIVLLLGLAFGEEPVVLVLVLVVLSFSSSVMWGAPIYSTQSNVRVTAFFQFAYSDATLSADIWGFHSLSLPQYWRSSSVSFQNPTARPAA